MKSVRTVPRLVGILVAISAATCSLADLDGLSEGRSSSGGGAAEGGAGGEASVGSGNASSSLGTGAASTGAQGSGGDVAAGGGPPAGSTAQSSGTGCMQICDPGTTTYVDCMPCYKRPDTCSSDGCSISQGECTAFQCQADQICGASGQCCFGDGHYCDNPGACCGNVCAGNFCYSCKPYGEPCSNSSECCPGAPYCEGTCVAD
jgi:hypothetical protein